MAYFKAVPIPMGNLADREQGLSTKIKSNADTVEKVKKNLSLKIGNTASIKSRLNNIIEKMRVQSEQMQAMERALGEIRNLYVDTEQKVYSNAGGQGNIDVPAWAEKTEENENLWKKFGLGVLGKAGIIGSGAKAIIDIINNFRNGTWDGKAVAGTAKALWSIGCKVAKTVGKAKKSGVTSVDWAKDLLGLGKSSSFQKIMKSGLSNADKVKHSFDSVIKSEWRELKKASGIGKIALSGVINGFSNYDEYMEKYKNGEVSKGYAIGRGIAETIGETAVDWGKDALIAAGVTAGLAAAGISAPAVVVGAAAVGVGMVLDVGCKWVTGTVLGGEAKGVTEVVSDLVLDGVEAAGKGIVKAGKAIGDAAKSVADGAKSLWKGVSKAFAW